MNGEKLTHAIECAITQNHNRRAWQEGDTADQVAEMIQHEAQELVEAIQEAFLTGEVFPVASEIGDLFFLLIRLCEMTGLDPADVLRMKTKRNAKKYDDDTCNNGYKPEEVAPLVRSSWSAMGGDKAFSHIYLDFLAEE